MKSINELLGVPESYRAPDRVMEILTDEKLKHEVFNRFLENFNFDVSYDWFYDYFQDKHADRSKLKQDFTPKSVSSVLQGVITNGPLVGLIYEPSAGTGGNLINAWNADTRKQSSFDYKSSNTIWWCEEISDRSIPFLLFNLMIRGMNAVVVHGDTLTREAKKIYVTTSENNWHLDFCKLEDMTGNQALIKMLGVHVKEV